jgi:hypothetical protein
VVANAPAETPSVELPSAEPKRRWSKPGTSSDGAGLGRPTGLRWSDAPEVAKDRCFGWLNCAYLSDAKLLR